MQALAAAAGRSAQVFRVFASGVFFYWLLKGRCFAAAPNVRATMLAASLPAQPCRRFCLCRINFKRVSGGAAAPAEEMGGHQSNPLKPAFRVGLALYSALPRLSSGCLDRLPSHPSTYEFPKVKTSPEAAAFWPSAEAAEQRCAEASAKARNCPPGCRRGTGLSRASFLTA